MQKIIKFRVIAGVHHDPASGNTYACTADKRVPAKEDADDQNPTIIPGVQPVFESATELDKMFRGKFQRVPEDTPVTGRPDASALKAMAQNEKERLAAEAKAKKNEGGDDAPDTKGNKKGKKD